MENWLMVTFSVDKTYTIHGEISEKQLKKFRSMYEVVKTATADLQIEATDIQLLNLAYQIIKN